MAIKIANVDVIDNSRNLVNVNAATIVGTVTAGIFSGSGAGLTGTATGLSIGGNAATADFAVTAANGGVTSVNGLTGAVTVAASGGVFSAFGE